MSLYSELASYEDVDDLINEIVYTKLKDMIQRIPTAENALYSLDAEEERLYREKAVKRLTKVLQYFEPAV